VIHRLFASLILALPAMLLGTGAVMAQEFEAGKDYQLVTPAQPGGSEGKVQVVELFWYGCPHCYDFEPQLERWIENKPEHVEFIRIPAIFNRAPWALHAQTYYTAEALEVLDKFHRPFFNAIHQDGKRMASEEDIRDFFAELGVDAEEFDAAFNSFAVQSKVRRAADLTKRYGITGVPAMIVNGKYRTGGRAAGTFTRKLEIVDALVAQEAAN